MKRNLFDELKEGFNALQSARDDKISLRLYVVLNNRHHPSLLKS
jgi:hypothetical protein